jgi:hypothetical protein
MTNKTKQITNKQTPNPKAKFNKSPPPYQLSKTNINPIIPATNEIPDKIERATSYRS